VDFRANGHDPPDRFSFNLSGVKMTQATATSTSKSEIFLPLGGFECTDEDVRASGGRKGTDEDVRANGASGGRKGTDEDVRANG
jgi:hypothetical protein